MDILTKIDDDIKAQKDNQLSKGYGIRISNKQAETLQRISKTLNIKKSELIRLAIENLEILYKSE